MSDQSFIQQENTGTQARLAQIGSAVRVVSASGGVFQPSPHEDVQEQTKIANLDPLYLAPFALMASVLFLNILSPHKLHESYLMVALRSERKA